jgi:two-component system nitrate/nitrite response regulator NarL
MAGPVSVAIVDDHPVVIEGVSSWLARDPEHRVEVVHTTSTLDGLSEGRGPTADVVVLDLLIGGQLIVDQIPRLAAAGRRVVAFSAHLDAELILNVLEAGAVGYVTKDEANDHLVDAILAASGNRPYVTRSQAGGMLSDTRPDRPRLSRQERQALRLWFQGMNKSSVARRMSITENTVRQYIDRARIKYASAGRPAPTKDALLARAIEDGLITPAEVRGYRSYASGPTSERGS